MFSILSWNILQGGGSRIFSILNNIGSLRPTSIVFSEYRNNENGQNLRNGLLKLGYRHQFVTQSESNENSVLISSLLACTNEIHPQSDKEFGQNILSIHYDVFSIMGVYLPHKKKHSLFDFIINHTSSSSKPYIITGDFNSGINKVDQEGDSFWYSEKLIELNKRNYIDAFRYKNGEAKEYSWYSHQGNGYRYDHSYIHESLCPILKTCNYLHEWRESKLSDHSPMYIELG